MYVIMAFFPQKSYPADRPASAGYRSGLCRSFWYQDRKAFYPCHFRLHLTSFSM